MNCKRYVALLHEYVDCTLPQKIQNDINAHMEVCPRCKTFYKTYSLTITLSRKIERTCSISDDQLDCLKALLIKRLFKK